MPELTTVLTSVTPKQVTGKNGTFTMYEFLTQEGMELATSKKEIAHEAMNLLNHPVSLEYEEKIRGEYTNRYLQSIAAVNGQADIVLPAPEVKTTEYTPTFKDQSIWRQTAAKVAVQIVGWAQETDRTFENVIVVADQLAKYFEKGSAGLVQKTDVPF